MILDQETLMSNKQAITVNAVSTNVIDLGASTDLGPGRPIPLLIQLTADASGTAPTLQVDVQVSADEAFTSPKNVISMTFTGGSAGDKAALQFVPDGVDARYMRLNYTVGGTTPAYEVVAGLSMGRDTNI